MKKKREIGVLAFLWLLILLLCIGIYATYRQTEDTHNAFQQFCRAERTDAECNLAWSGIGP